MSAPGKSSNKPKTPTKPGKKEHKEDEGMSVDKDGKPVFPAVAQSSYMIRNTNEESEESPFAKNQLYVSNLPEKTNMAEMSKLFPDSVTITLGVNNASEPHAAFVEFSSPSATEHARMSVTGATLRGNTLIVSEKLIYN